MNQVSLIGRLTKDPEIRYSQAGKAYAKFTLAVDKYPKGENGGADFIPCTAFGTIATVLENNGYKGQLVGVAGKISTGSYTNKDGRKVYTTDVMVDRLEVLEWKDRGQGSRQRAEDLTERKPAQSKWEESEIPFY